MGDKTTLTSLKQGPNPAPCSHGDSLAQAVYISWQRKLDRKPQHACMVQCIGAKCRNDCAPAKKSLRLHCNDAQCVSLFSCTSQPQLDSVEVRVLKRAIWHASHWLASFTEAGKLSRSAYDSVPHCHSVTVTLAGC